MTALRLDDLGQYSDTLHLRSGQRLSVRFVEPRDADTLQAYVRGLSISSRYRRFLGAARELPPRLLEDFTHAGEDDRFSVIATIAVEGVERIVAEARYALNADQASVEFGVSVDDQWQGHGIGAALLQNLECRAAALGARRLFGDVLRSNEVMIALARKTGFALVHSPGDWRLVRFEKQIASSHDSPCASWQLVAASRQLAQQAGV
jgi:GNAT superfamily N-acetyltransferase